MKKIKSLQSEFQSQFQRTSTSIFWAPSLFLGITVKADSQPLNWDTGLAFKQFTAGKKVTSTTLCEKFNRYTGFRINAQGTMETRALEKALQRFKTYADFWRMGKAEKVKAVFQPEKTTIRRQRSVKKIEFLGNTINNLIPYNVHRRKNRK